jgi:hypothetical protein
VSKHDNGDNSGPPGWGPQPHVVTREELDSAEAVGRRVDRLEAHLDTRLDLLLAKVDAIGKLLDSYIPDATDRFEKLEQQPRRKAAGKK